jgi:N-methylhydantoinase A/oxoprolinase/acetone carboxylase beta subunit
MTVGIDIGGTNTDGAIVGDSITTFKVSNELGIGEILRKISRHTDLKKEKLIVSTSLPLNLLLSRFEEHPTLTLLFPGSGLNYESYGKVLKGAVNHRGDVVEDIDEEEIIEVLEENKDRYKNVAIASKFSVRNPLLELKTAKIVAKYYGYENMALSYHIPELNYPLRINTTIINAKIKKTVCELTRLIKSYANDFFYYKGDGGIIPYEIALDNPSELYNSSPASVAIGAIFLTKEKDALVVDIGGTTTDFVMIEDGKPKIMEKVEIAGRKTLIRCVESFSIPFGGDSVVENYKLKPTRLDRPIAFGGEYFTLTDALNCIGFEIGDYKASREKGREELGYLSNAEKIVEDYVTMVAESIRSADADKIIGTGYLARYLTPMIAKKAGVSYVVPEHSEAVNAIGVAVSKISLTLYARFDTERGIAVYNGDIERIDKGFPKDDEFIDMAIKKVRREARKFGASYEDVEDVKVLYFNCYTVVRGGVKRGKIADVIVQIEPGISSEFR